MARIATRPCSVCGKKFETVDQSLHPICSKCKGDHRTLDKATKGDDLGEKLKGLG